MVLEIRQRYSEFTLVSTSLPGQYGPSYPVKKLIIVIDVQISLESSTNRDRAVREALWDRVLVPKLARD